jgi:hypothetical protein
MRAVIVAAALLIGTAAYAQDTSGSGGMQQGTGAGASGQTVAPGNEAPKRDSRGVPVVSAPASAPTGWNQPPGVAGAPPSQPAAQQGSAGPLPPCTRHVTDHCTQTYERNHGAAGSGMAAAGGGGDTGAAGATGGDTGAAADTGTGTTATTHHRRRHHRK